MSSPSSSSSPCRHGRATASCISRILRRILCFNTLPLCSFDHQFKEEENVVVLDESGSTPPGLVARLMGLDSLPLVGPTEESPTTSTPDSFKTPRVRRRRIIPDYQETEDENFFILSFERRKSCRRKGKENEVLKGNLEFEIKVHYEDNIGRNVSKNSCRKPDKAEDDLENSSPNSVLEFVGFKTDQESDSPGEISRLANSKMRRPLSDKLESCGNSRERKLKNNGDETIAKKIEHNFAEKWDEVGELAAMETMKSSCLRDETAINRHCLMEISREVESAILDHLLDDLLMHLLFL